MTCGPGAGLEQQIASLSIFEQDWWLDAATAGRWTRAETRWDGHVVCSLPYTVRRHWGLTYIQLPPYTRTLAPRLALPPAGANRLRKNCIRAIGETMAQLPRHDRFELTLPPGDRSTYSFVQLGYMSTATYTFRSAPGEEADAAMARMDHRTRHHVRAAARHLTINRDASFDTLIRLTKAQWHGRDKHDYAALERLWAAVAARGQGCVLAACDDKMTVRATSALIWDDRFVYHWLSARDAVASHEATALIIWEAMRMAIGRGLIFDADGYDSWETARSISRFGLTPALRPVINRGNTLWRTLHVARTALRPYGIDRHFRC